MHLLCGEYMNNPPGLRVDEPCNVHLMVVEPFSERVEAAVDSIHHWSLALLHRLAAAIGRAAIGRSRLSKLHCISSANIMGARLPECEESGILHLLSSPQPLKKRSYRGGGMELKIVHLVSSFPTNTTGWYVQINTQKVLKSS